MNGDAEATRHSVDRGEASLASSKNHTGDG